MLYYATCKQMRSKTLIIINLRIVSCNLHRRTSLVSKIMNIRVGRSIKFHIDALQGPPPRAKLIASIFLLDGNDHLVTDTFQ